MRTSSTRSGLAAGALTLALMAGGSLASAAPQPADEGKAVQRVSGPHKTEPQVSAKAQAAQEEWVLLPDLAITHSLPSGGMNLWRMPLSELEPDGFGAGFGEPQLVKKLDGGGFSYSRSKTVGGNFGSLSPTDDGTADHVIWHSQPDGSVLLWAVPGAAEATDREPRLWADLRTGGWSFDRSQVMAGDVTGDGWDDLVVVHLSGANSHNVWVFPSDGSRLGGPQLWAQNVGNFSNTRWLVGDVNADGFADLVNVSKSPQGGVYLDNGYSTGGGFTPLDEAGDAVGGGWSFDGSRQMIGEVTGDGVFDVVSIHAQYGNPGMLVWVHPGQLADTGGAWFAPAQLWQDLRAGGWSYANSRQHLADTNGDWIDDVISVHAQWGIPGELVWRHVSSGAGIYDPQIVADLRTGGWNYHASRESVAVLFGTFAI